MLDKSEVIAHNTVYHSRRDGSRGIVHRYGEILQSDDPPYILPILRVTEEWQQVPCGHITSVGKIVVRNDAGAEQVTLPTDAEKELLRKKVVELSLCGSTMRGMVEVRPGCSETTSPVESDPEHFRIRSRSGVVNCWVMVIPR